MIVTNINIRTVLQQVNSIPKKLIGLDFETVSLKDKTVVAFTFAYDDKKFFVPIRMKYFSNVTEDNYKELLKVILNQEVIFHHSAFDLQVLDKIGLYCEKAPHDTLIISHLHNENGSHKLKDLVKEYLNYDMLKFKDVCGTGKKQISFRDVSDKDVAYKYAVDDAVYTLKLFNHLYPFITAEKDLTEAYSIERPLLLVINDMHLQGVPINGSKIASIKKECEEKVDDYKGKLDYYMLDVNINSSKQLKEYFIDKKRMPVCKRSRKTDAPSVDSEVLKQYSNKGSREAEWILKYREYNKILSTFVPALVPDAEGLIHPHFHQVGTTSGRFSSSDPNFQNIPVHDDLNIRACIEAPKGNIFIGADYGQMELRLTAHMSQDKNMMETFNKGKDIHSMTSSKVGCSRSMAKVLNFGILYGMGVNALAKNLGCDRQEANKYKHEYRVSYPSLERYMARTRVMADRDGYLTLLHGRRRHLPEKYKTAEEWSKQGILRSMSNATIQGGCAMIIKKAMILMYEELEKYDAHIIAQVHDEVIVMCKEEYAGQVQEIVERCMIKPTLNLSVPFTVDSGIGKSWQEIHG